MTKIRKIRYIRWGNQSPYIIHFYYKRYGFKYEGKRFILWNNPEISEGERIDVYINDEKREKCYIEV